MARFNTALTSASITGTATIGSPNAGSFTNLTGTAPYTVTVPNPQLHPGVNQVFYNATSGTVTLTTPSGNFNGTGGNGTASISVFAGNVVSITSDGTHYIVISEDGSALTATTGSFSGNVTMNGSGATVSITPSTLTVAPTGASTIDSVAIGSTTRAAGAFTSLAANAAVTFTANTASSSTGTGTLVVTGGIGASGQVTASAVSATNLTGTLQTAAQPNITSVGNLSTTGLTVNTTAIVSSGTNNVGINTASPKTNGATFGTLTLNGSNGGAIQFTTNDVNIAQIYNDANALFINPASGKTLSLQNNGTTAVSVGAASVAVTGTLTNTTGATFATTSGNLGVGVSSPGTKLDLGSTQGSGITLRYDATTNYRASITPYWNSNTDTRIDFAIAASSGSAPTVYLSVGYAGNVGIGTQTPAYKLHVAGTSGTDDPRITPINSSVAVTATSVFVYDTRKDSDGGAWRKRTQNTSWYNETLNSATRGARREFPAVAVIVATTATITIYDGDSPDLPLWITYPANSFGWDNQLKKVNALNGIVAVANYAAPGYSGNGLRLLNFVSDIFINDSTYITYSGQTGGRRVGLASTLDFRYQLDGIRPFSSALSNYEALWVEMTVLPNAPVDPATDLPTPTIAIATTTNVSVIRDNGTIQSLTWAGAALRLSGFNSDNAFCAIYNSGNTIYNVKYKPPYTTQDTSENYYYNLAVAQGPSLPWNPTNERSIWAREDEYIIGSIGVLRYLGKGIDGVPPTRTYSVQTTTYNSGYMVGDIKGAWLSSNVQETVVSSELITNGTFDSSTTGWTAVNSTLSVVSGALRITNVAGAGSINGRAQFLPGFATIPGKSYVFTVTGVNRTANNYYAEVRSGVESVDTWTSGSMQRTFVAVQTTTYVELYAIGASGVYAEYDNVSVRVAEADRSTNFKGLQVFGSVVKTPVATNADLVSYSNFSTSNYLVQPYNNNLDFGTGDFSICLWFLASSANAGERQSLVDRVNSFYITREYTGRCYLGVGAGSYLYTTNSYTTGTMMFVAVRKSGVLYFYVNGVLDPVGGVTNTNNATSGTPSTYIGVDNGLSASLWHCRDKLSLLRISATAPSDAQILKMYNDEKHLFQESAKATLYGASDNVTALAYDADTQLLHVGTSSGRSVFNGLRRVDNTATAVATSISASNGLVAEQ